MRPLKVREEAGILILSPEDPAGINDSQTNAFREALYQAVEGRARPRVVLDLAPVDFLSSSGISALISLKRRTEQRDGALVLCNVQPYLLEVLQSMKILTFFRIRKDLPEALAEVAAPPAN